MDPTLTSSPEFQAADDNLDTYLLEQCDADHVDVTAGERGEEHFFDGVPTQLRVGLVSFTVHNTGRDDHEMNITVDGGQKPTGYLTVPAGQQETILVDFQDPASYTAVCTLTDEQHPGMTHAQMGMTAAFEVSHK